MKKSIKALATILMAATNAKALDRAIVITKDDFNKFEIRSGQKQVEQRLLSFGIIVSTNKSGLFLLNDEALSRLEDEQTIQLISDLVVWLTDGNLNPTEKNPNEMRPSTQDYKL